LNKLQYPWGTGTIQ